jgi:hypothetical protein
MTFLHPAALASLEQAMTTVVSAPRPSTGNGITPTGFSTKPWHGLLHYRGKEAIEIQIELLNRFWLAHPAHPLGGEQEQNGNIRGKRT